jgi:hypothetical protein
MHRKPETKRTLGKPRRERKYNIKVASKKWGVRMWAGLIWLRMDSSGELL